LCDLRQTRAAIRQLHRRARNLVQRTIVVQRPDVNLVLLGMLPHLGEHPGHHFLGLGAPAGPGEQEIDMLQGLGLHTERRQPQDTLGNFVEGNVRASQLLLHGLDGGLVFLGLLHPLGVLGLCLGELLLLFLDLPADLRESLGSAGKLYQGLRIGVVVGRLDFRGRLVVEVVLNVIADIDLKDLLFGELGFQQGFGFLQEDIVQVVVQDGVGTELPQDGFGHQLGVFVGAGQYQDAVDVDRKKDLRHPAPVDEVGVGEVRRPGIEVDVGSLDGKGFKDTFQCGWRDGLDNLPFSIRCHIWRMSSLLRRLWFPAEC